MECFYRAEQKEAQSDPEQALEPVGAPGLGRHLAEETV